MTDWDSWRKHVDWVVETRGRWYGLGDGDGAPLVDLSEPLEAVLPEQWAASEDLSVTVAGVEPGGRMNRVAELLVAGVLDDVDESGRPRPAQGTYTLLVALRGPGGGVVRRGGVVTHVEASDADNDGVPERLVIHALNAADVWRTVPAVSWPAAWWKAEPYEVTTDESGVEYGRPWSLAKVELASRTFFTVKNGPAGFVIRRLAQESLDAAMASQRDPDGTWWVDDPFHVVEVPEHDSSPEVSLEARDGMLWDTVSGQAQNAGLLLGARLWWPGDPPVRCWSPVKKGMDPAEVDISPSEGESKRTLSERSFPHVMVVLTVTEVGDHDGQ
nr:MAG TPA: hypothetical protein [Caudoviricetes sp.]